MRRSVVLATGAFLDLLPVVRAAETAGFHRVWTTETPNRDALVRALVLGLGTSSIGVATGIAYAFTRAPLAMAAAASDTQVALGGRFSLGLGAGTQGMRTRWFGVRDFDHPASRLAEYAQLLRAAWAAPSALRHDGRFYTATYDQLEGAREAVPLWGSGVNPTMLRLAARSFDGVALHPLAGVLDYLDSVALPALHEGAARRDGAPGIACWRMTSIAPDGELARRRARRSLAFYLSTPSYRGVAEQTGWGTVADRVAHGLRTDGPRWDALADLVPEEMLGAFCLAGTPAEVAAAWAELEPQYAARGVHEVVFQTVAGDSGDSDGSDGCGADVVQDLTAVVDVLRPAPSPLAAR